MRFLAWLLVFVALVFVGVSAVQAAMKWWEVSNVVDEVVIGDLHTAPARAAGAWAGERRVRVDKLRLAILQGAAGAGVTLTQDRIAVVEEPTGVRVRVRWAHPVLTVLDEVVLAVPLSIDRSFGPGR